MKIINLEPGSIFATDYRIIRKLNAGGMGDIYLAEQISVNCTRALKLMKPQLLRDPDLRRRFEQEAKIGARIASEHVVQVVAAGVDEETEIPWLAMEFLDGEDLGAALETREALPLPEVLEILRQLCHALHAAHSAGIVHRDLKPENIMLARSRRSDSVMTVKILDFGISKIIWQSNTVGTGTIGTPQWMAPEQTSSEVVTPAADVWALGLIAFRLLSGRHYWVQANSRTPSIAGVMREVVVDPLVAASVRARQLDVGQRLPAGFDAWFGRCVIREAGLRFPDARAAFEAFEASVIRQQPLQALHAVQKSRIPYVVAGVLALTLGAAGVASALRPKPELPHPGLPDLGESPDPTPAILPSEARTTRLRLCHGSELEVSGVERATACRQLCFDDDAGDECVRFAGLIANSSALDAAMAYQRACEGGKAEACVKLAGLYMNGGPALPADRAKALPLYRRQCDENRHVDSCLATADLMNTKGESYSAPRATYLSYYRQVCNLSNKSNKRACRIINPGPIEEPIQLSRARCRGGNPQSCVNAIAHQCLIEKVGGACYVSGGLLYLGPARTPGLRRDRPRSLRLLQQGCQVGHLLSCDLLRQIHEADEGY